VIKPLLGLLFYGLAVLALASCAYAGWFALVWGFHPLIGAGFYAFAIGLSLLLVWIGWALRLKRRDP
jgi:hypothetical protein